MDQFPPNSDKSKNAAPADAQISRVTTSDPVRRRKPLGKQLSSTFIGGDAKSAWHYVVFSVLIPAAKEALVDAGTQGIEKLVFGEARAKKSNASGNVAYVAYNKITGRSSEPGESRTISNRARATHNFDEIVLRNRGEAEMALQSLYDVIGRYESVSVANLYSLVGIKSDHVDQKWGWTDLRGSDIVRVRGGYLLDLPEPEPLS